MPIKIIIILLLFLLNGCATRQQFQVSHTLKPSVKVDSLIIFDQEKTYCGPATLATLFHFRGINKTPQNIAPFVYLPGKNGSFQMDMVAQIRSNQLIAYPLKPTFNAILEEINAGNPVLVLQNNGFSWWPKWHYNVVSGYDENSQTVRIIVDNQWKDIPYRLFDLTWERSNRWAITPIHPTQIPATANEADFAAAINDLESVGHHEAARDGYQTLLKAWPKSIIAHFGLGNIAYLKNQFAQASEYFLEAIQIQPRFSDGWNNLAYALKALGCDHDAKTVAQCAYKLSPTLNHKETLEEINTQNKDMHCEARWSLPSCPIDLSLRNNLD